jgi:hypothetical protein
VRLPVIFLYKDRSVCSTVSAATGKGNAVIIPKINRRLITLIVFDMFSADKI